VFRLLVGLDQLRHLGIRSHGLDQDDVMLIQKHSVGTVHFIAAPHQHAGHCLGFLVDLALDVVHVGQFGKIRTSIHQLAIVKLIIVEQDGRVGRSNLRSLSPFTPFTGGQSCHAHHCYDPHDLLLQNDPLILDIVASRPIESSRHPGEGWEHDLDRYPLIGGIVHPTGEG